MTQVLRLPETAVAQVSSLDIGAVADELRSTEFAWRESTRIANSYTKAAQQQLGKTTDVLHVPSLVTRRKCCFQEIRNVKGSETCRSSGLLASYWLIRPHHEVIDFAVDIALDRNQSPLKRAFAWRLILGWAHTLDDSIFDEAIVDLNHALGFPSVEQARNHLATTRSAYRAFVAKSDQCLDIDHIDLLSGTQFAFDTLYACLDAIEGDDPLLQCAAISCGLKFFLGDEIKIALVDQIARSRNSAVKRQATLGLVYGWSSTEDEYLVDRLLREINAHNRTTLEVNLCVYALLGVSGLIFIPQALLSDQKICCDLSLFED